MNHGRKAHGNTSALRARYSKEFIAERLSVRDGERQACFRHCCRRAEAEMRISPARDRLEDDGDDL